MWTWLSHMVQHFWRIKLLSSHLKWIWYISRICKCLIDMYVVYTYVYMYIYTCETLAKQSQRFTNESSTTCYNFLVIPTLITVLSKSCSTCIFVWELFVCIYINCFNIFQQIIYIHIQNLFQYFFWDCLHEYELIVYQFSNKLFIFVDLFYLNSIDENKPNKKQQLVHVSQRLCLNKNVETNLKNKTRY